MRRADFFRRISLTAFFAVALISGTSYAADPPAAAPAAPPGTVTLRVVVVNPSATKVQNKEVKVTLPKEITSPKHVLDTGGLAIDYDNNGALFYVHQDVALQPGETKTFEVVMEDVWFIPAETLNEMKTHTDRMMEKLSVSEYKAEAEPIAARVYQRLDVIKVTQAEAAASKDQKISQFRDNTNTVGYIRTDIEQLEKLVTVLSKQAESSQLNEFMKLKDREAKTRQRLSQKTWIVIVLILLFIGILGATFYFTWQRQAKIQENIFSRERDSFFSDKPASPPDEKKGP